MDMIELQVDVVVVGAGFGGSLVSLLLKQIGLTSVLIDRGTHPRFAIGESTTPIANLILEDLAKRYGLPQLLPFSNYGSWKRSYPEMVCGLKRGFSYFHHTFDQDFQPRPDHANELLVAASAGAEDADTHWLRSDFDHFFAKQVSAAGIPYFDKTKVTELNSVGSGWEVFAKRGETAVRVAADLVIDASGEGGFMAKQLKIPQHPEGLRTRSRGLFSHFVGVKKWHDLYVARGGIAKDHPYPCDDAALHHVFDGGWMWVLPFDNGVTSAGFSLDPEKFPLDKAGAPADEWQSILKRLPAVAEQFSDAVPTVPWVQAGRMQRRYAQSAGPNWVMLPNTAAFHDPLHSTGNAFTLVGIERLLGMLECSWKKPNWEDEMRRYDALIQAEAEFIDLVVSGSFAGFREFERMVALSMFYFSTATWSEQERRSGRSARGGAFLSADHAALKSGLIQAAQDVADPALPLEEIVSRIRTAIAPFNRVGLADPAKKNLYPFA